MLYYSTLHYPTYIFNQHVYHVHMATGQGGILTTTFIAIATVAYLMGFYYMGIKTITAYSDRHLSPGTFPIPN